jgi:hypothetical protein
LKHTKPQAAIRVFSSLILLKELVHHQFDNRVLLPYIRRVLAGLWTMKGIDIVSLLLNLGLAEYVHQMPEPERSF